MAAPAIAVHTGAATTSCGIDGVERIVAVGDVHGAYDRLVEILRAVNLIDARLRWSGGHTHLVQLGDVVGRGPDSRRALDLLRHLEPEAASVGGRVHLLLGNHEAMRMLGDLRDVAPGEYRAFVTSDSEEIRRRFVESAERGDREQRLKSTPLGLLEMRAAFERDGTYGKWLRTLDSVVKINGVLFVHGGISPAVAPLSCDEINTTVRRELTTDLDQTRAGAAVGLAMRANGPLWYRGLATEADTFAPDVDDILRKQKARAIVVGHTVTPGRRIRVRFAGKVVEIDTGMQPAYIQNGRASALEIRGGKFTAVYLDRRDTLVVASASTVR